MIHSTKLLHNYCREGNFLGVESLLKKHSALQDKGILYAGLDLAIKGEHGLVVEYLVRKITKGKKIQTDKMYLLQHAGDNANILSFLLLNFDFTGDTSKVYTIVANMESEFYNLCERGSIDQVRDYLMKNIQGIPRGSAVMRTGLSRAKDRDIIAYLVQKIDSGFYAACATGSKMLVKEYFQNNEKSIDTSKIHTGLSEAKRMKNRNVVTFLKRVLNKNKRCINFWPKKVHPTNKFINIS